MIKKTSNTVLTKLNRKYQKFHGFLKLPAEFQDLIIEHAISEFESTVNPAYKHKCNQPSEKRQLRWKVSGTPRIALNLQLVS